MDDGLNETVELNYLNIVTTTYLIEYLIRLVYNLFSYLNIILYFFLILNKNISFLIITNYKNFTNKGINMDPRMDIDESFPNPDHPSNNLQPSSNKTFNGRDYISDPNLQGLNQLFNNSLQQVEANINASLYTEIPSAHTEISYHRNIVDKNSLSPSIRSLKPGSYLVRVAQSGGYAVTAKNYQNQIVQCKLNTTQIRDIDNEVANTDHLKGYIEYRQQDIQNFKPWDDHTALKTLEPKKWCICENPNYNGYTLYAACVTGEVVSIPLTAQIPTEVNAEANQFMKATSDTLLYDIYLLGQIPGLQQRVADEKLLSPINDRNCVNLTYVQLIKEVVNIEDRRSEHFSRYLFSMPNLENSILKQSYLPLIKNTRQFLSKLKQELYSLAFGDDVPEQTEHQLMLWGSGKHVGIKTEDEARNMLYSGHWNIHYAPAMNEHYLTVNLTVGGAHLLITPDMGMKTIEFTVRQIINHGVNQGG